MSVRQDFTDFAMRVESFLNFMKNFHEATLYQFRQLQDIYIQYQDLVMDNDISNTQQFDIHNFGVKYKIMRLMEKFHAIFQDQQWQNGPFYYGGMIDEANSIYLDVNLFSWIYTPTGPNGSIYSILNAVLNTLSTERVYLNSMGPNEQESRLLMKVDSFWTSVTRLMQLVQATIQDGSNMFDEMYVTAQQMIFDFNPPADFEMGVFEEWDFTKERRKEFGGWFQNLTLQAAVLPFETLLRAVINSDGIDSQIAAENNSFGELTVQHEDLIASLQAQIAKLQSEIQSAQEAASIISNNTSLISMKQQQKSDKESEKATELSYIDQWNADIAALDPTSETYADDLASLEAKIAKSQAEIADLTEAIAQLQADIAQLTEQNVGLSGQVDQLPVFQSQLAETESDVATENQNFNQTTDLHYSTLYRYERRRQDLPLNSSPWERGGQLYSKLVDRLNNLGYFMDSTVLPMKTYSNGWQDIAPIGSEDFKVSIETPGMPELRFSVSLDGALAQAMGSFDGNAQDELLNSTVIYIPELNSNMNVFGIVSYLFDRQKELDKMRRFKDAHESVNFIPDLMDSYRMDSYVQKLDEKKADVDSQLAELVSEIDALSTSIQDNKDLKDVKLYELEGVESSIEETSVLIDKTTMMIDSKEAIKAAVMAKKAEDEDDLAALDPTSETYADDAASLQAQITKAEAEIADLTSEIEAAYTTRAEATATLVSLSEQQSSLQSEISVINETIAKDASEKADLTEVKKGLDDFVASYDGERNNAIQNKDYKIAQFQMKKDEHENACKMREEQIIVLKDGIQKILKQVKVVKSKSNIRNN